MTYKRGWILTVFTVLTVILLTALVHSQVETIVIPAGTPEDNDLNTIANEQDAQKKAAMYQDFLQKYASNQAAVAYANWQLSQYYQSTGDLQKALEFGADSTINNSREDAVAIVMALTGGLGVDVAVESVGMPESFELCTELVRPGGRVANVGVRLQGQE